MFPAYQHRKFNANGNRCWWWENDIKPAEWELLQGVLNLLGFQHPEQEYAPGYGNKAVVVCKEGSSMSACELRSILEEHFQ